MRLAAEIIVARSPHIFCAHGIDEGDALVLATRFDCGYAYRARQALFWDRAVFGVRSVFDRQRGLLQVFGAVSGTELALVAAQFSSERLAYVRELRAARTALRKTEGAALLFVNGLTTRRRIGFADLDFASVANESGASIAARGARVEGAIVKV